VNAQQAWKFDLIRPEGDDLSDIIQPYMIPAEILAWSGPAYVQCVQQYLVNNYK
jgi:hypothetical protein